MFSGLENTIFHTWDYRMTRKAAVCMWSFLPKLHALHLGPYGPADLVVLKISVNLV